MVRSLTVFIFVLFAATLIVCQTAEQALKHAEDQWGEAFAKKDTASLDKILADDWVGQYEYGKRTKTQMLDDLKSEKLKVQSVETSDEIKVKVFGDTAIVTGGDNIKGSYKGKDISGHELWTDVFVKSNGQWQAVASQNTLVTMP
jgi:ketosteroid isomerase-like protein